MARNLVRFHRCGHLLRTETPPSSASAGNGAASVTPSILRLMIAAILGALLTLCSLAIERVTGDKKTAVLREQPPEMMVGGSSVPSTPADIQPAWSIGSPTR